MPKLVHIARSGDQKARIGALALGESFLLPSRAQARTLYQCAVRLGVKLSIRREVMGQPAHRVTRVR